MPVMDGRELARQMFAIRPDMKILPMSGYEVSGVADRRIVLRMAAARLGLSAG